MRRIALALAAVLAAALSAKSQSELPAAPPFVSQYAGALTATTAIGATTTPTTGGVTLTGQSLAAGSVWRVRAFGNVVAPSSATVRTLNIQASWGGTNLTAAVSGNVLASTAQTTNWFAEVYISASSTTAAWVSGYLYNSVATALASGIPTVNAITSTSNTGLPTGPQTIDFRVNNGTAAVDAFNVMFVTIERMQ